MTARLFLVLTLLSISAMAQSSQEQRRQEEADDYYKKWLGEDVKYIITDEEKKIFLDLATPDEKDQFIEQFWRRRDTDLNTAVNEFKEEHYRRIAYANDHFDSGLPGWMSDRGRIYIIWGPPESIDRNPSGGAYQRPLHEGGGGTATYPFEVWHYRYIEGVGDNVDLEFVDKTWTNEYKLALNASEKDVFLNTPGHGLTLAEQVGLASKERRLNLSPALRENYPLMQHRIQDSPFALYEKFSRVKAAPEIKYPDLKEAVSVNVSYRELPFELRQDYVRLNEQRFLVPLTLSLPNKELTFEELGGHQVAKVAVYGLISNISNQIVDEFEDDVVVDVPSGNLQTTLQGTTLFQRVVFLEAHNRYKLSLVARDLRSAKTGVLKQALTPPNYQPEQLALSSLILSDFIQQLPQAPEEQSMFVLGDIKVRPSVSKAFPAGGVLGLYLQAYNTAVDQTTSTPAVLVTYRILQGGRIVSEHVDNSGQSVHYYNDQRVVIVTGIPLQGLEAGHYQVQVEVRDLIRDEALTVDDRFQVVAPPPQENAGGR